MGTEREGQTTVILSVGGLGLIRRRIWRCLPEIEKRKKKKNMGRVWWRVDTHA